MNIIFDGNYHFHKTLGIFKSYTEKESNTEMSLTQMFEDSDLKSKFFRKLIADFCHTVRSFDDVKKVVFVFDNPNWRKVKYPFYKHKEKDEIDLLLEKENEEGWTQFYKLMSKFEKHLSSIGIITSRLLDLEGDDLTFFFATHYSRKGQKTIVITGDKDSLQTLDNNIAVYRNNSMSPAFFHNGSLSMMVVGDNLKKKVNKLSVEEINPIKHLFVKILIGDTGDNIPNLFKGLGKATAEKIYDIADENLLLDCEWDVREYTLMIAEIIKSVCKKSPNISELVEAMDRNSDLMWLDESVYTIEQLQVVIEELDNKSESFTYEGEYQLSNILKQ